MKKSTLLLILITIAHLSYAQEKIDDNSKFINIIYQFEKNKDTLNQSYIDSLSLMAVNFVKKQEFLKAENLLLKILDKNPDSATLNKNNIYGNLGVIYHYLKKYTESEYFHLKSVAIKEKYSAINPLGYSFALKNLALLYEGEGEFKKAEKLFLLSLEIETKELGENNLKISTSLNYLGEFYFLKKYYQLALNSFLKSLAIYAHNKGENNLDYSLTIHNLGTLYGELGNYNAAESYLTKSLKIRADSLGEMNKLYLKTLNNLSSIYLKQRNFPKVEPLRIKSLEITEYLFGKKSEEYAESLIASSNLFRQQGDYFKAESFIKSALDISKAIFGENHVIHSSYLSELASLKYSQGNYIDAEVYFNNILNIQNNLNNYRNKDIIETMNGLASTMIKLGKFSESEDLFKKLLEKAKNLETINKSDLTRYKNNLAQLYDNQRKYSEAQQLYLEILDDKKKELGEKSFSYAISLNNLALSYRQQGKYLESEPFFLKSLEIKKEVLGTVHPSYITNLLNLAVLYRLLELNSKSAKYFEQFIDANQSRLLNDAYNLTQTELFSYVNQRKSDFVSTLSFLKDYPTQFPNNNIKSFENEIRIKNLTLRNHILIKNSIKNSGNDSLYTLYERLTKNKKLLSKLSDLPIDKSENQLSNVKNEIDQIEKDLVQKSTTFSNYKTSLSFTYNQVREKLKENEVLVEFTSFRYYKKSLSDSIFYCAFLVGKNFNCPKFITLFEEKELRNLLFNINKLNESDLIERQYKEKLLSKLIINPILKELDKNINTIYVSMTGLTYKVNMGALLMENNKTLSENFQFHILNSPSDIFESRFSELNKDNNTELILFGGIDFNQADNDINNKPKHLNDKYYFKDSTSRMPEKKFSYLIGSKNEVTQIQRIANDNRIKSTIYTDKYAIEESVKKLDGKKESYILHLATHGFYYPRLTTNTKQTENIVFENLMNEDPMNRSGLIFAGANNNFNSSKETNSKDNGVLTAREISQLDLSECQLVVLSACETGLGDINGFEGVFGLQRAFKMAGAKNIIMSLWKVPDIQTKELFEKFYENIFEGQTFHNAFSSAQKLMKSKYPPYYWAGFVLLE